MFDYTKLKARIKLIFRSQSRFAEALYQSDANLSKKLNGEYSLTQMDILQWAELLDIPREEIVDYFLTLKGSE